MNDSAIEQEIQAKGLTAPRITPADIETNIDAEYFFRASDGVYGAEPDRRLPATSATHLLTFCVIVLKNGFTVTGESACASPENFDAELGRKIARQNAINKVWPLMGYALKDRLFVESRCAREEDIVAFRRYWNAMVPGVKNALVIHDAVGGDGTAS